MGRGDRPRSVDAPEQLSRRETHAPPRRTRISDVHEGGASRMSQERPPPLTLIKTGVPGLDQVLGGGLPEYSFNLLCGAPGSGKTTLIQQLLFANATPERPALYFTVLGEPALKMLRYQQQMEFFDANKVGSAIHFVDLGTEALKGDLPGVLQ